MAIKNCPRFRYLTSTSSHLLRIVTMRPAFNRYLKSRFTGATIMAPPLVLKIDGYIGAGYIGAVFYATETSSGRPFAVKIFKKTPYWRQEATLHRFVSAHPNIITLHTTTEYGDFGLLILEYCDGPDLHRFIHHSHAFAGDTTAIKRTFLQIIDAVQFCHQNTVYHRDLKLENVLYDSRTGEVFLTDFGVATDRGWSTDRAGTVRSMSPGEF